MKRVIETQVHNNQIIVTYALTGSHKFTNSETIEVMVIDINKDEEKAEGTE